MRFIVSGANFTDAVGVLRKEPNFWEQNDAGIADSFKLFTKMIQRFTTEKRGILHWQRPAFMILQ